MSAISDIRKDVPIHLELASMTDRDFMNSIMQEVHVEKKKLSKSLFYVLKTPSPAKDEPKDFCVFN